jgi:hypothetical protein
MEIGSELVTERGIGTYLGNVGPYGIILHLSPAPVITFPSRVRRDYSGDIDILFSKSDQLDKFIGCFSLNDIVKLATSKIESAFTATSNEGQIRLTREEFQTIDEMAWTVLSKKYGLAPVELVI